MKCFCIQIQPELNTEVNPKEVMSFLSNKGYIPEVTEGNDSGKYINLNIKTNNIKDTWSVINTYLKENNDLSCSSIVTCEGSQGWGNYLLLHHFDSAEKLNEI